MNQKIDAKEKSFNRLKESIFTELKADETLSLGLDAEETLFSRFNNSMLRQTTHVSQGTLTFDFTQGQKRTVISSEFTGDYETDIQIAKSTLDQCRHELIGMPDDPFIIPIENYGQSRVTSEGKLLSDELSFDKLLSPLGSVDATGIYTSGPVIAARANNLGMNHWYATESFYVDYSLYSPRQKAVKDCYASTQWNDEEFKKRIESQKNLLTKVDRPSITIKPGKYRTYFAPAAANYIVGMLGWWGLSSSALKQGRCALEKLHNQTHSLSSKINLTEDFTIGVTPRFSARGELSDERVELIKNGELVQLLTSSKTAKEYDIPSNGADEREAPRSLCLGTGKLEEKNILKELGTGIYISNLWYLNWSDMANARITGMTRYACFWVENGEIVAPIEHMRFDDSLFHILGEGLVDLTSHRELELSTDSYYARELSGSKFPGILVNSFNLTL